MAEAKKELKAKVGDREGWGFPLNSKRAHYFERDVTSLCNKWMFFGPLEQGNDGSPDNCTACMRALAKRRAKGEVAKLKAGEAVSL